jgi:hypothetical protein
MLKKLKKEIDYKYKIPSYAPLRVGDVVRICNAHGYKKYANSKEPYMNKLGVVIGYSTKSGGGPMTFAVRLGENGDEYLLYNYLLVKTGSRTFIPKFEEGDEVIVKSKKIDGKWAKVLEQDKSSEGLYRVQIFKDNSVQTMNEKQLRFPTKEELVYKNLEQKLPELEGIF